MGFPGCTVVKSPPASAGDTGDAGSILGSERTPGVGNGNSLQYSCLENPMDRSQVRYSPWGHKVMDTSEQPSTRTDCKGREVWEYTRTGLATCEHRLVDNC